ncbi:MAG: hypothetical protein WA160_03170 [Pseudobdellovibrio sp.]
MPKIVPILLIILFFSGSSELSHGVDNTQSLVLKETVLDKKQDKGPVYNPLRVKPYTKRMYKS